MFPLFGPKIPTAIKKAHAQRLKETPLILQIRSLQTSKVFELSYSPIPLLIIWRENAFFQKEALICGTFLINLLQSMRTVAVSYTVSAF